jgi:hypothetical protein
MYEGLAERSATAEGIPKMNSTVTAPHIYRRRRATPWPIRVFLVVAILFGIWVDVSTADSNADDQDQAAANPDQTPLLGLSGMHSLAADIVRTLASRRS